MEKGGYAYILSSKGKRLYTGVTAQLQIRVTQHKAKKNPASFASRYNINQLVYYEACHHRRSHRPRNIHRLEKIQLIVALNPTWRRKSIAPFQHQEHAPAAASARKDSTHRRSKSNLARFK
jgi:putative endonuclease